MTGVCLHGEGFEEERQFLPSFLPNPPASWVVRAAREIGALIKWAVIFATLVFGGIFAVVFFSGVADGLSR
ncbi:MAG TPA: hypothetical protein VMV79_03155 [Alphaproteobacteria bacterium]|nr:hypothetical protein [Alphaproteobacteria bacterium]